MTLKNTESLANSSNETRSVLYCPESPQFIWDLNHTISLKTIVAITTVACPVTVLLNLLVIIAMKTRRELKKNSNILLSSVALADLLVGAVSMPLTMTLHAFVIQRGLVDDGICTIFFISGSELYTLWYRNRPAKLELLCCRNRRAARHIRQRRYSVASLDVEKMENEERGARLLRSESLGAMMCLETLRLRRNEAVKERPMSAPSRVASGQIFTPQHNKLIVTVQIENAPGKKRITQQTKIMHNLRVIKEYQVPKELPNPPLPSKRYGTPIPKPSVTLFTGSFPR